MGISNFGDNNGWVATCDDCQAELPGGGRFDPGDAAFDAVLCGWEYTVNDDGVTYADATCEGCLD